MARKILVLSAVLMGLAGVAKAETYYEILSTGFQKSADDIAITDFDVIGDPDAKVCVEISPNEPNDEHLIHVGRFTFIKEGRGPDLPEIKIVKVIYSEYTQPDIRELFEYTETNVKTKEVKTVQSRPVNMEIKFRKNDGKLFFEKKVKNVKAVFYGYCYPRS